MPRGRSGPVGLESTGRVLKRDQNALKRNDGDSRQPDAGSVLPAGGGIGDGKGTLHLHTSLFDLPWFGLVGPTNSMCRIIVRNNGHPQMYRAAYCATPRHALPGKGCNEPPRPQTAACPQPPPCPAAAAACAALVAAACSAWHTGLCCLQAERWQAREQ